MMGSERLGAHMDVSILLLLTAVGGWGAFAYAASQARQQERSFREQICSASTDRDALNTALRQARSDAELNRQELERARRDLAAAQLQIKGLTELVRTREQASGSPSAASGRASSPTPAPNRLTPGSAPRQ